jgi:hypothetical protein
MFLKTTRELENKRKLKKNGIGFAYSQVLHKISPSVLPSMIFKIFKSLVSFSISI